MTKKNIDIVKIFIQAGAKGDMEAARSVLDDNIEWIEPEVPGLWFSGRHKGADAALREVVKPTFDYVDDFKVMVDEYIDGGREIIALCHFLGTSKQTGEKFNIPVCFVCSIKNDKIVRFRAYHNTALWVESVGIPMKKAA